MHSAILNINIHRRIWMTSQPGKIICIVEHMQMYIGPPDAQCDVMGRESIVSRPLLDII